ncbi:MAG TPA: UPF0149 family protein [Steroidobacteraceae bacterium]|nr:UPF0149 family protein [Steroidobacteraceae bacterium]
MNPPDYTRVRQLLAAQRSLVEPAEAHGTLAGCLCAVVDYRFEDFLREILPEGQADREATDSLYELYGATLAALDETEMDFRPLLPADEEPIAERTRALAAWCQGFLYGLGSGAIGDASGLPGEVGEIVRDFAEITRAGVEDGPGEDSNESAYAELVEFVRVGVQLLYEELAPARRAPLPAAAPLH